jgi:hypothetical protein
MVVPCHIQPGGPDPWDPPNSICLLTDPTYAGIEAVLVEEVTYPHRLVRGQ